MLWLFHFSRVCKHPLLYHTKKKCNKVLHIIVLRFGNLCKVFCGEGWYFYLSPCILDTQNSNKRRKTTSVFIQANIARNTVCIFTLPSILRIRFGCEACMVLFTSKIRKRFIFVYLCEFSSVFNA